MIESHCEKPGKSCSSNQDPFLHAIEDYNRCNTRSGQKCVGSK